MFGLEEVLVNLSKDSVDLVNFISIPAFRSVSGISHREETLRPAGGIVYFLWPGVEQESVAGERAVWVSLLDLLSD